MSMSRRALGLTDFQLRLVWRAAGTLPLERRDQFLKDIAARLGESNVTIPAVKAAIGVALSRTTGLFLCDSASVPEKEKS
jgi:hypothetical protein